MSPSELQPSGDFAAEYSERSFWAKLADYALAAGREVVEKALVLYYAASDADTPGWARATCVGALGYFISPLDAIPDLTPVVGYSDDLGVLVLAVATIAAHVKPQHEAKAAEKRRQWFA